VQFRVYQERTFDALSIAEVHRVFRPAVADDYQFGPTLANRRKRVAQLRDLLSAEQSAEMPDERQHHRTALPEISQADGRAVGVENDDVFQLFRHVHCRFLPDVAAQSGLRPQARAESLKSKVQCPLAKALASQQESQIPSLRPPAGRSRGGEAVF